MQVNLFTPHTRQKQIIDQFASSEHKFGVVATGRQFGKSLLGQNLLLYWLLKENNQKAGWVSPIYNQAKKVFKELTNAAHHIISEKNKADLTIRFINGSTLQFLSAERPDSIRGFSFNYVVIDEAAFIKEVALTEAILPTMTAIGKKALIISTPKSKNWFYNYWIKGTTESKDYISFQGISEDNPYVDTQFIAEQQLSLPADIYRQEYLAEFTDAGSEVFRGLDNVCILNKFDYESKERCYAGIDTGLSNDFSALCIQNEAGRVLYMEKINGENITTIAEKFVQTCRKFNITGGYIETNGIGKAMFDLIRPKIPKLQPFTTTQDSKTTMVRSLIQSIEEQQVELPSKEYYPDLYKELSLYTYKLGNNGKLSFTHPAGHHDDLVDALLMANHAKSQFKGSSSLYIGRGNLQPTFG